MEYARGMASNFCRFGAFFHLLVALNETQSLNVKFISKYPSKSGSTHKHIVKHIVAQAATHRTREEGQVCNGFVTRLETEGEVNTITPPFSSSGAATRVVSLEP
jgi:hypothetical protein